MQWILLISQNCVKDQNGSIKSNISNPSCSGCKCSNRLERGNWLLCRFTDFRHNLSNIKSGSALLKIIVSLLKFKFHNGQNFLAFHSHDTWEMVTNDLMVLLHTSKKFMHGTVESKCKKTRLGIRSGPRINEMQYSNLRTIVSFSCIATYCCINSLIRNTCIPWDIISRVQNTNFRY